MKVHNIGRLTALVAAVETLFKGFLGMRIDVGEDFVVRDQALVGVEQGKSFRHGFDGARVHGFE